MTRGNGGSGVRPPDVPDDLAAAHARLLARRAALAPDPDAAFLAGVGAGIEDPSDLAGIVARAAAAHRATATDRARDEERERADEARDRARAAGVAAPDLLALIGQRAAHPPEEAHRAPCGVAERFASVRSHRVLILRGPVGSGKTWAACCALGRADGALLRASRIAPGDDWSALRRRVERAGLVVVDDLGCEHSSEWSRAEVESLLCQRYDDGKRTIATTNLDAAGLAARYGARLADRWASSACVRLTIDGPSRRAK